jgi:flagellar biosynthesis protein FlhG
MDQAESLRTLVRSLQGGGSKATSPSPIRHKTQTIAFTSGKGGVGKTSLSLNIAIALSKQENKKILVLDTDLGTANVDIILGVFPKYNISHVLYEDKPIEDVVVDGPFQVKILPGVSGVEELTTLTEIQQERFYDQLERYQDDYQPDYIFVDTGAGIGSNVISFLLASDEVVIIATPEPTSMSDAYAIIKTLHKYDKMLKISVLVNMVSNEAQAKRVFSTIKTVSERFLSKELSLLGYVRFDRLMSQAIRKQKPVMITFPNSQASGEIEQLSKCIINKKSIKPKGIRNFFEVASTYLQWNHD